MAPTKNQTVEPDLPPVDESTEGWETIREESPTVIIFDEIGDQFTGRFNRADVIHNPQDGEDFTRYVFTGLDDKPYAFNASYALDQALAADKVQPGDLVRLTYVKDIPVTKGNPLKDVKVEVKRA